MLDWEAGRVRINEYARAVTADPEHRLEGARWTDTAPQTKDEHSLQALIELSKEIHTADDLYQVAEVGLLNFMGLLSTSSAAIWGLTQKANNPVLLRRFGLASKVTATLGELCVPKILSAFDQSPLPVPLDRLHDILDQAEIDLARQAKISMFGTLFSRGKPVGAVALGEPAAGLPVGESQLKVFEASLYHLGVALENTQLYSDILTQNQELRQAQQHLKEMDQIKQNFLNNMHHELRTPLTIILSYLEMVLKDIPADSVSGEMLTAVQEQATNLQRLVENLLAFNESQNETLAMEVALHDISDLARSYHEERRPGVSKDLRELALFLQPDLPRVLCDPERLRQILDELLNNAVKFTPPGTKVVFSLRQHEFNGRPCVRFEINDNGPGIPADKLSIIFDSFRQGDGSVTRSVGGIGLGLPLVQQLSDKMGIHFEFQSEEGKGTTCALLLPAIMPEEETTSPTPTATPEVEVIPSGSPAS